MSTIEDLRSRLSALEEERYANHYALVQIEFCGETNDPPAAAKGRAEALGSLDARDHEALTGPATVQLIADLETAEKNGELSDMERAQLRVLKKDYAERMDVPAELSRELTRASSEATVAWKRAKAENDWDAFAPHLEKMIALRKEQARCIAPDKDPYDVMLDLFEPGTDRTFYDAFFDDIKSVVVPLVAAVGEKPAHSRACVTGYFDEERQWNLDIELVAGECLPQDKVVYGKTEHPFSDGIDSSHVFVAGHVYVDDIMSNVFSMLHEGGHALYEAGVNPAYDRTCLRGGTSMGMHESQSRLYENMVGRDRHYMRALLAVLAGTFPREFDTVTPEELYEAVNIVEPSFIRTEADELTYPLHVMARYDIEQKLFSGELAATDVPAEWARLYKQYLGVDVPDDRRGALQDTHWAQGSFGYFPTYALGSAWAAQLVDAMRKDLDVDAVLASGSLKQIYDWLQSRVWWFGRSKDARDIMKDATGCDLDASHYTGYLARKFCDLYDLDPADFISE